MYDLGGDPFGRARRRRRARARASRFTDIMDAFFGGRRRRAGRGPRSAHAPRPGRPVRLEIDLAEAAFGIDARAQGRHRGASADLRRRSGTAPGTHPVTCDDLPRAAARCSHVQRSFLGEVMTLRPVRRLPRLRHDHPPPLPRVLRRRPGARPPHAHRQDPRRRRHRHPRPAARRGRGRPGRRPGRRPLRRDPRRARTPCSPATATTCTATVTRADDRRRARHHAPAADCSRPTSTQERLDVELWVDLEIRPGTQSGTEQPVRGRGVPAPARRRPRRPRSSTSTSRPRPGSTPAQEELLRELAKLRGEESPDGQVQPAAQGRLRPAASDAFNGRDDACPVHLATGRRGPSAGERSSSVAATRPTTPSSYAARASASAVRAHRRRGHRGAGEVLGRQRSPP